MGIFGRKDTVPCPGCTDGKTSRGYIARRGVVWWRGFPDADIPVLLREKCPVCKGKKKIPRKG